MNLGSNHELEARWLDLSAESQQSLPPFLKPYDYVPTHLLGLRGRGFNEATLVIKSVQIEALLSTGDLKVPYFEMEDMIGSNLIRVRRCLYLGSTVLSDHLTRPELGNRYDAFIFSRHSSVEEERYADILDEVITRTNSRLALNGVSPIPTLRDVKYPFNRLFGPDS